MMSQSIPYANILDSTKLFKVFFVSNLFQSKQHAFQMSIKEDCQEWPLEVTVKKGQEVEYFDIDEVPEDQLTEI